MSKFTLKVSLIHAEQPLVWKRGGQFRWDRPRLNQFFLRVPRRVGIRKGRAVKRIVIRDSNIMEEEG